MLLVLAPVLPLLLFQLGHQYADYREDVAATGEHTLALARGVAQLVDGQLETRIFALQTLATSTRLHAGDIATFRPRAEAVLQEEFPNSAAEVVTADGREIMNTALPPDAPVPIRPNLDSVREVFATGHPVVSNIYKSAVGNNPVVAIDVPVKSETGAVIYVLAIHPRLDSFAELIRRQHFPAHWIVSIIDRNGMVIAHVPGGDTLVGHAAPSGLVGPLRAESEGVVESVAPDGTALLAAFSHSERFGWTVAIGIPRSELLGPVVKGSINTLATGAALLVLGLLLAVYASRHIAGPIDSLRRLAAASGGDALPAPAPTGVPEVDDVAQGLYLAEEARRRSQRDERALRDGIETMPQGFVIYDEQDRLVLCNQNYRDFYPETADTLVPGVRFEEILRAGIERGRFPSAKGREEEWIADRVNRQHEAMEDTIEQRLADGRWVLVTKHRLPNGWVAGLRVDITALKAAEEALRRSESRLRRAQHLAQMGSDIRNLRTDEAEWSDETYRIMGIEKGAPVPSTEEFLKLVHPDDRETILAARDQLLKGVDPAPFEYRIVRADGSTRHIYRESEVIADEDGRPLYMMGTLHDVTERRRTEEQLQQAQKMEAIGNLTGGMAHDFNNLLGVVVGNLDLARNQIGENKELQELIGEALEAAWRGADLTRRLLAFARRQPLRPARVKINDLVGETVRLLRRLLGEDVEVSLDLGADIWPATVDPAQLESSLTNLANNARDAMPNGGRLIVATANRTLDADYAATHSDVTPGDFVMIEISDTGTGMPAEVLNQIFEPFFTTKEQGRGTGLGLSMVFGFMKQSGGHVNVYSELGQGTTFRLYLPRAAAGDAPREVIEAEPIARGAGETVLVVEDNSGMRRIVLRQLRDLGYRVLDCDSGAAALEILGREAVDLLLTDIVMPGGVDGIELAGIVLERWPALKILLTSGFPQARVNGNGNLPGGLQLLSKPYRQDELAAALRATLGG